MKKLVILTLLVVNVLSLNHTAMAVDSSADPYVGKNLSILRCTAKDDGGWADFGNFGDFLNALIWNDSLGEGVVEPWKDALFRNQCQASDLKRLVDGQDKLRKAIRDAFLTCKTQKLDTLTQRYFESLVEIYYVRHIVKSGLIISLPIPALKLRPWNEAITEDRDKLYAEMQKRYVKDKFLTQSEFDVLFSELEAQYGPGNTGVPADPEKKYRKDSYIICDGSSWSQVGERWDLAVDNFKENWDKAGETISNSAAEVGNEFASSEDIETGTVSFLKGNTSAADYFSSFVKLNGGDIRDEGKLVGEAFSEVGKEFTATFDGVGTGEYASGVQSAKRASDLEAIKTELMVEFANLYYVTGDQSLQLFLNSLDGRLTDKDKSDGLIEILEQSLPQLRKIEKGCDVINSKQCS
ncbi:hypothetical protein HY605_00310 [Candidatus Peregrinibacteria bacterium]|nr:hypothetical protein [Candidatus Peregrinibacteria bacterium]